MSDSELIDWEQLEMIFGEDDECDPEMAELFHEFVDFANEQWAFLDETPFDSNREAIAKCAHKLKGSSSNFGFKTVSATLGDVENNVASHSSETYATSIAKAKADFKASVDQVAGKFPVLKR